MTRLLRRLAQDRRGVTALEFAFVVPPLLFLLMGGGEIVYQAYVQSILDGAIQKAGRDSSLQGAAEKTGELDAAVLQMVRVVAKDAFLVSSQRDYYASFAAIRPERFDDTNKNGIRDPKECFDDVNANKVWDADPRRRGQGGANDVTMYTMKIGYKRLFPVGAVLGWNSDMVVTARTLLKNQPYATQAAVETICT